MKLPGNFSVMQKPRNKGIHHFYLFNDKFGVTKLIFAEENTVFGQTLAVSLFLVAKNKGNTPLLSLCDKLGVPKLIFAVENTIFGQTLAASFVFSFIIATTHPPHPFFLSNRITRSTFP